MHLLTLIDTASLLPPDQPGGEAALPESADAFLPFAAVLSGTMALLPPSAAKALSDTALADSPATTVLITTGSPREGEPSDAPVLRPAALPADTLPETKKDLEVQHIASLSSTKPQAIVTDLNEAAIAPQKGMPEAREHSLLLPTQPPLEQRAPSPLLPFPASTRSEAALPAPQPLLAETAPNIEAPPPAAQPLRVEAEVMGAHTGEAKPAGIERSSPVSETPSATALDPRPPNPTPEGPGTAPRQAEPVLSPHPPSALDLQEAPGKQAQNLLAVEAPKETPLAGSHPPVSSPERTEGKPDAAPLAGHKAPRPLTPSGTPFAFPKVQELVLTPIPGASQAFFEQHVEQALLVTLQGMKESGFFDETLPAVPPAPPDEGRQTIKKAAGNFFPTAESPSALPGEKPGASESPPSLRPALDEPAPEKHAASSEAAPQPAQSSDDALLIQAKTPGCAPAVELIEGAVLDTAEELVHQERAPSSSTRDAGAGSTRETTPSPSRLEASAAWLRAALTKGSARAYTAADGWKVMEMTLDEGDGALVIKARREEGRVAVTFGFSDPDLRALATSHAIRLQEILQAQYEAPVDLSFFGGQTGAEGQRHPQAQGDSATTMAGAAAETEPLHPEAPPRPLLEGTQHEWIG